MKIICVGCMKTGTTTFGECMKILGFRHQSYDYQVVRQFMAGNRQPALDLLKEYDSFDDWPFFIMYREIAELYPDAKFILTTRPGTEVWLSSISAHVRRVGTHARHLHRHFFGIEYPQNDPEAFQNFYERHNASVREYFGDRLTELCWETGDGWDELCDALGVAAPDAALPHANSRESRRDRKLAFRHWVLQKIEKWELERYQTEFPKGTSRLCSDRLDPQGPIAPYRLFEPLINPKR